MTKNIIKFLVIALLLISNGSKGELVRIELIGVMSKLIERTSHPTISYAWTDEEVQSSEWLDQTINIGDEVRFEITYSVPSTPDYMYSSSWSYRDIANVNSKVGFLRESYNSDVRVSNQSSRAALFYNYAPIYSDYIKLTGLGIITIMAPTAGTFLGPDHELPNYEDAFRQHCWAGGSTAYRPSASYSRTFTVGSMSGGVNDEKLEIEATFEPQHFGDFVWGQYCEYAIPLQLISTSNDIDSDGAGDAFDNCPNIVNIDQFDFDLDGIGDACDLTPNGDSDIDGIDELSDNCPNTANVDQSDLDQDSIGDACDSDKDGDDIRDDFEEALGGDPANPNDAKTSIDLILGLGKQVPAMGGIGLLALGLSMLGLGAVRMRRK